MIYKWTSIAKVATVFIFSTLVLSNDLVYLSTFVPLLENKRKGLLHPTWHNDQGGLWIDLMSHLKAARPFILPH